MWYESPNGLDIDDVTLAADRAVANARIKAAASKSRSSTTQSSSKPSSSSKSTSSRSSRHNGYEPLQRHPPPSLMESSPQETNMVPRAPVSYSDSLGKVPLQQRVHVLEATNSHLQQRLQLLEAKLQTPEPEKDEEAGLDPQDGGDEGGKKGPSSKREAVKDAIVDVGMDLFNEAKEKANFGKKLVKHQKGVIQQVSQMPLEDHFDLNRAYAMAVLILSLKFIFTATMTVKVQQDCSPTTALIDGDKNKSVYQNMYSKDKRQYICSTFSMDAHYYGEKSQEWLQNNLEKFGGQGEDPRNYLDLSQEGFSYMWTGYDALIAYYGNTEQPPQAINSTDGKISTPAGWKVFEGIQYVHNCAEKCGYDGYNLGFLAEDFASKQYQCWCSNHTPDTVCQANYLKSFGEDPARSMSIDDLPKDRYNAYTQGFNTDEIEVFENIFKSETEGYSIEGCRYDYRFPETGVTKTEYFAWGDRVFYSKPFIVFSQEPPIMFKDCTPSQTNSLCQKLNETLPVVEFWANYSSSIADLSLSWEETQKKIDAAGETHRAKDPSVETEYWYPCTLAGKTCEDYEEKNKQCSQFRNNTAQKEYCGAHDDGLDDATCFGVTSITYVTCANASVTLGASLGYVGIVEYLMVSLLVAAAVFLRGDRAKAFEIMIGSLKQSVKMAAKEAIKEHTQKLTKQMNNKVKEMNSQILNMEAMVVSKIQTMKGGPALTMEEAKERAALIRDGKVKGPSKK